MDQIRKILKEETDKRDMLKDRMKRQLTAGGTFNLGKVVKTFGVDNPIMKEVALEWANEGLQRLKTIIPTSEAEATFLKMFDGIYVDVRFEESPDSIFFLKGDPTEPEWWFELKNSRFWCDYIKVWRVFSKKHSMGNSDIQYLIKTMMDEAFRLSGIIPDAAS